MTTGHKPGRVALVTGTGGYLGGALAAQLAGDGWAVALHYRASLPAARASLQDIRIAGGEGELFRADLAEESQANDLVARIVEKFGRLDAVVNCASTFVPKKLDQLTLGEWRAGLDSTVTAAFLLSRAALPELRRSGAGRLVHMADSMAHRTGFTEPAFSYYVGKVGVWMLVQTLAVTEAEHGVTVNAISPGLLESSEELTCDTEYPLLRRTTAHDIYGAVKFLLGPEAEHVTGTNILVSGGWNIAPVFHTVSAGEAKRRASKK